MHPIHILVQRSDAMADILVYPAGSGSAAVFAAEQLKKHRIQLVDHPSPDVTHLLLDVPCREIPKELLRQLPESVTVVGGNLDRSELEGCRKLDFLKNDYYLAKNAAITADCAVRVAAARIKTVFSDTSALVIGWGRIGKCLAALLKQIGCRVTVAARKTSDRAMLNAFGFDTADSLQLSNPKKFDLIFNTVPSPVLNRYSLAGCPDTLKIDLASKPGLEGPDVVWARGLPGLYTPESSGKLIAETFLKLCREGTS